MPKLRALSAFWKVDDRLGASDDHALDRLIEVLVEDAGGEDVRGRPWNSLPARVDVVDQRALEVGVAPHGAVPDDIGELELGKLAELRPVHGLAVAEPEIGSTS